MVSSMRFAKNFRLVGAGALAMALLASCGEDGPGGPGPTTDVAVFFNVTRPDQTPGEYFELPFPNVLRMKAGGGMELTGLPAMGPLVELVRDLVSKDITGASTNGGIYFRFTGEIDPETLPPEGVSPADASVFLVNIEPTSIDYGKRAVLRLKYDPLELNYIGKNALSLLPYPGFPLRQGETYAAVVTTRVLSKTGVPVLRAPDLAALLGEAMPADATLAAAWPKYQPLRDYAAAGKLALGDVAGATVFTTQRSTDVMAKIRKVIYRDFPAPPVEPALTAIGETDQYLTFEGRMDGPNFQVGTPPYSQPEDGGGIEFDANGDPKIVRTESIRFAMTIPKGQMPAAGWPVALYAHGTGGSYKSFIGDSIGSDLAEIRNGQGEIVSKIACISIDQVLHGPRKGDPEASTELTFFNFNNPVAFRDNIKQGALDDFQLVRFVETMNVDLGVGQRIKFDPSKIYFAGHSQGGLTGPLFLAAEPKIKAAILSGAGGVAVLSLLGKTEPVDIAHLVKVLISDAVVDEFHPLLTLIQTYMDSSDPINYARLITTEPPKGQAPKHIFQTLGLVDSYTPVPTIKALATALSLSPVEPLPAELPGMLLAGLTPLSGSVTGNLTVGSMKVTATLTEYIANGYDGHFVVFRDSRGARQAKMFLGTMVENGVPTVVP